MLRFEDVMENDLIKKKVEIKIVKYYISNLKYYSRIKNDVRIVKIKIKLIKNLINNLLVFKKRIRD